MIIICSILFTLFLSYFTKWILKDEKDNNLEYNKNDEKWHLWILTTRIMYFISLLALVYFKTDIKTIYLAATIHMPLYDIFINKISLNKPIFYSGSSSFFDKTLKNKKWFLYLLFLVLNILFYI